MKWKRTSECKPLTKAKVDAIVALREAFEKPIQDLLHVLDACYDCPNQHYSKVVDSSIYDSGLQRSPLSLLQ